jgi:hypothetical protein
VEELANKVSPTIGWPVDNPVSLSSVTVATRSDKITLVVAPLFASGPKVIHFQFRLGCLPTAEPTREAISLKDLKSQ